MLTELRIRNLAIIDELAVKFQNGLNVLTGETGAGKSIIVDALGLALGDRAHSDMIRSGEKEAMVQALFELDSYESLPDIGIDYSEGLFLRRTISAAGKSRSFVNDVPATLQTLAEIGKALVDIHSQHEHQSLNSPAKQLEILDSYGRLLGERAELERLFNAVSSLQLECREIKTRSDERAVRLDLLRYQIDEIGSADLRAGEKEALEEKRILLSNTVKLNGLAETIYKILSDDEMAAAERVSRAVMKVNEMASFDPGVKDAAGMLESAKAQIEEAAREIKSRSDRYESEPGRLEALEERLELIRSLERKYGSGTEAVLSYMERAIEEVRKLETDEDRLSSLEKELNSMTEDLSAAGASLSKKRKETALEIERKVAVFLKDLAFAAAAFKIEIYNEKDTAGGFKIGPSGIDKVEFLFSANPGEPLKPLSRVASGGELSRVMLALKSVLATVDRLPVLIFDEVDAGIGGVTAESVGLKLGGLSRSHQVICITHLPQIAAFGQFHLRIEKATKGQTVRVEVKELDGVERRDEIARMLSGKVTDISASHAVELLERTRGLEGPGT